MRFKDYTIGLQNLQPQLVLALIIVDQVMQKAGQEALITSLNDARHSKTSLHYAGAAVDLRSKWFQYPGEVLVACKDALGNNPDFDMIWESQGQPNEHFHLEFQQKRRD